MSQIKAYKKTLPFFFSPLNIIGIILLCNPVFGVVDILPDAIGALCLYFGLTELSFIDSRIDTARTRFLGLAAITGAKLVFTPALTRGVVSSDTLAATAFFGVIEALVMILAFGGMFEGLSYAVTRRGSSSSLKVFEGAKMLTYVFIVLRVGLNIVPELSSVFELAAVNDITNAELFLRIAALKNYFHLFNGVIVFIMGAWWCINTCSVFGKLKKDLTFVTDLSDSYGNSYSRNMAAKVSAWLKHAFRVLALGLVFYFNLDILIGIDDTNVLPNFVGTAFVLLAVCAMGIPLKKRLYKKFNVISLMLIFAAQIGAYFYRHLLVDISVSFFSELVWWKVLVNLLVGGTEVLSFILLAKMCNGIFIGYVKLLCGEQTASLMYSPMAAVFVSSGIYLIGYTVTVLQPFMIVPQIAALIWLGAVVNANVEFVRGGVESAEVNSHLCADL